MNERAFAKRLEREIPGWQAKGWVSAYGSPATLADLANRQPQAAWASSPALVVSIGLAGLGTWHHLNEHNWDATSRKSIKPHTLQVRYGIEPYLVQEGSGRTVERPPGGDKVSIRVAIDARGNADILAVLFDGNERFREPLF